MIAPKTILLGRKATLLVQIVSCLASLGKGDLCGILALGGSNVTAEHCLALLRALSDGLPSGEVCEDVGEIVYLDLSRISLGEECTQALVHAIPKLDNLRHFILHGCDIPSKSLAGLLRTLSTAPHRLETLDLSNSCVTSQHCLTIGQWLVGDLEWPCSLCRLSLDGNVNIGSEGASALATGLLQNAALKTLNLRSCRIGHSGGMSLLRMLFQNTSLVQLKINFNQLGTSMIDSIELFTWRNALGLVERTIQAQELLPANQQNAPARRLGAARSASFGSVVEPVSQLRPLPRQQHIDKMLRFWEYPMSTSTTAHTLQIASVQVPRIRGTSHCVPANSTSAVLHPSTAAPQPGAVAALREPRSKHQFSMVDSTISSTSSFGLGLRQVQERLHLAIQHNIASQTTQAVENDDACS